MIENQNLPNENSSFFNGGYSNYEGTKDLARHRWYYYKEGFSPLLVEKAIEQTGVKTNELILDPFNGSGTTTLTAALNGYKSVGIEVNPFTSFLSDAKIRTADVSELKKWKSRVLTSSEDEAKSSLIGFSTFSETNQLSKWLFNDSVLNSFEGGWQLTSSIPSPRLRKLIRLALISAAMQNCNAKRDGKCLRYSDNWKNSRFDTESFCTALSSKLDDIEADIQEKPILEKPLIIQGDCRSVLKRSIHFNQFKLCITSPPYLNTFDYTDIYRPELFLGKFIKDAESLYRLRLETVRSHVQAKWKPPIQNDFGYAYDKSMTHINSNTELLMHKNIPMMIQAYFEDMLTILKLMKARAAKDAQIWFIVSNSAYAGYEVPVDLIIGELASKAGWFLKEIVVLRHLKKRATKNSTNITHLRESAIILTNRKIKSNFNF